MSGLGAEVSGGDAPPRSSASNLLTIRLLGVFDVSVDDRVVEPSVWRLRKATHLVKLLALSPGHRMHRDQLIDALWPEVDPDSALSSFHQALHAARRALEPDRPARSSNSLLRLHQQVLSLESADEVWIDAEAFQAAALDTRSSGDLESYAAALSLYTGELLPEDLYESWTQRARDSLRQLYLDLLLTTAQLQEERGAATEAIEMLRSLIDADPLNESAYAALMQLHARSGRRDQAIRLYQQLSETLESELDAEPSPEVASLYARINSGELNAPTILTAQPVAPTPATSEPGVQSAPVGGLHVSLSEMAQQSGLVARQTELDLLQNAFETMLNVQGQIVLLAGEPGIGKTRLAEEFAHFAGVHGATVLWARCHEASGTPAFWPWSQIVRKSLHDKAAEQLIVELGSGAASIAQVVPHIRSLLPDTPEPANLDSEQARFRFFDSVTTFLNRLSEQHSLVLIIDDLHWSDRSSLMLLEFLTDEIASRRILLIGTYRDAEADASVPMIRTLERLNRSRATHRIQLSGFEIRDTAEFTRMVAGRPLPEDLVRTVYQRTNGNPFFLREVVQFLSDEGRDSDPSVLNRWGTTVPIGVREAITLRLSQLSEETRTVLTDAAVIGDEFQFEVLARVRGLAEHRLLDLLEEAIALGVIIEDATVPDRFRFTHMLTQQALYEGLIGARRVRMHARVGDVIENLTSSSADPPYAELAHHFSLAAPAGEAERAVNYLSKAGEQSMVRLAYSEAADQFRRTVEMLEKYLPDRQSTLFDLLLDLSRAQLAAGESSDARASRLRSVDVARALGDSERLALAAIAMVELGSDYLEVRARDEAALLEEALEALPPGDSPLRVQVMSHLAHTVTLDPVNRASSGQNSRLSQLVEDAVSMARRIGSPAEIADALRAAHVVHWTYEDVHERIELSRELLVLAAETGDYQLELWAHAQLTGEYLIKGNIEEADRELDAYEALATEYHLPINIWSATAKRSMRAFMRGDLDESERLMEHARAVGYRAAPEISQLNRLLQCFLIRREQDRLNEVEDLLASEAADHPAELLWQCLLAVLYADDGRYDQASQIVSGLLDQTTDTIPRDSFWLTSLVLIADACATLDDAAHAGLLLELLRPHADLFVSPGNHVVFLGNVSHYLGCLSATLRQWDDARGFFERAIEADRASNTPVFEARSGLEYASMLAKQGVASDTVTTLIDLVTETGLRHRLARVERLARDLQGRLPTCHSP